MWLPFHQSLLIPFQVFAICQSLGMPSNERLFNDSPAQPAYDQLLDFVETYFASFASSDKVDAKVQTTEAAPIYLQQPGHSLTIVGIERHAGQRRNLVVFDPSFGPSPIMRKLLDGGLKRLELTSQIDDAMKIYRRLSSGLRKHSCFETLMLVPILE